MSNLDTRTLGWIGTAFGDVMSEPVEDPSEKTQDN